MVYYLAGIHPGIRRGWVSELMRWDEALSWLLNYRYSGCAVMALKALTWGREDNRSKSYALGQGYGRSDLLANIHFAHSLEGS